MNYGAFGLCIASDVDLKPLPVMEDVESAVAVFHRHVQSLGRPFVAPVIYPSQGCVIRVSLRGRSARIQIDDELQFLMRRRVIFCKSIDGVSVERLRYWLLQKVLPLYRLLIGGVEVMHAGTVEVDGKAVGFLAPSTTGKSTMVRYFLTRDHALLGDEHLVVTQDTLMAQPTVPFFRTERLPESLGAVAGRFASNPVPLGAMYLLRAAAPDADVELKELRGMDALAEVSLQRQFELDGLGKSYAAKRMKALSAVVTNTRVVRLHVPRRIDRLDEVYAAVRSDLKGR